MLNFPNNDPVNLNATQTQLLDSLNNISGGRAFFGTWKASSVGGFDWMDPATRGPSRPVFSCGVHNVEHATQFVKVLQEAGIPVEQDFPNQNRIHLDPARISTVSAKTQANIKEQLQTYLDAYKAKTRLNSVMDYYNGSQEIEGSPLNLDNGTGVHRFETSHDKSRLSLYLGNRTELAQRWISVLRGAAIGANPVTMDGDIIAISIPKESCASVTVQATAQILEIAESLYPLGLPRNDQEFEAVQAGVA